MKDIVHIIFDEAEQYPKEKGILMELHRSKFLVKNFTDDVIHISLGDNDTHSIIPANSWEVVFNNVDTAHGLTSADATNEVFITALWKVLWR